MKTQINDTKITPLNLSSASPASPGNLIERISHELKLRHLTVASRELLTPNMLRIKLRGTDLNDFQSFSPDDHVKLFIPVAGEKETEKRDYTPRSYDTEKQELTLEFALHEAGPATAWAINAKVGDALTVGGPRGSQVVSPAVKRWLLIGDETALPAIARRLEELPSDAKATTLVLLPTEEDQQPLPSPANVNRLWLVKSLSQAADITAIKNTLSNLEIEPETLVWLAGESTLVKETKSFLRQEKEIQKSWLKAAGYWKQGATDCAEKFDD